MGCLRFALLLNGSSLERWHVRCLDLLEESAELAGIILAADDPGYAGPTTGSALMRLYARSVSSKTMVDATERFANVRRICADDRHAPIKLGELHFILKLGRGSIPTGMRLATRHGVWCFEHENREDPLPFFQEVYDAEDVTQAALLALGRPGGDEVILEQGFFPTEKRSYLQNKKHVLDSIAEWPARVCRRLAQEGGDAASRTGWTVRPKGEPIHRPQLLRLWARIAGRRLAFAFERLFRHPQWNIGVLRVPVSEFLRPGAYSDCGIEWFPLRSRDRFLADPFGIVRDGTLHILCEEFEYRCSKGHIGTFDFTDHGFARQLQPAIELSVHMSYPFLVEDAGEIYCIPETSHADEIALFRADEFPRRWSKVAVLVEQFGGVDPTVFHHDGRWWLMCTEKGREKDVKLWVWHAAGLRGPWTSHARNPVKTDVRGARPGGAPFVHRGVLYRPAQDCSKMYGWRIVIQRVTSLTPSEFVEEPVAVLEASAESPFPLGRHTLTPVGDLVLIDGHRTVFVWHAFRSFLKILWRDLSRKLRRR